MFMPESQDVPSMVAAMKVLQPGRARGSHQRLSGDRLLHEPPLSGRAIAYGDPFKQAMDAVMRSSNASPRV
jgi:hypothetical protein